MIHGVSIRIRRIYYDQIVAGTKTVEVRRASPYWLKVAGRISSAWDRGEKVVAVFVCGRSVHRRRITGVEEASNPALLLGREPSDQGKRDIGTGDVLGFRLGEVVA